MSTEDRARYTNIVKSVGVLPPEKQAYAVGFIAGLMAGEKPEEKKSDDKKKEGD